MENIDKKIIELNMLTLVMNITHIAYRLLNIIFLILQKQDNGQVS